ncbi:hypothetical protein NA57DRAFT_25161, partial [Rhizodiscina lignyota]
PPAPLAMDASKLSTGNRAATAMRQLTLAATTILKSCPQRDVIAMLILLLQLSPPVLFAVDFLYAIMTSYFPRPSSSALILPTFQGLFEGAGGAPSMATVILIDVIFFGLWVFMPMQVKNYGLDVAQAVIALSFSGAGSNSPPMSIGICLGTITLFRTLAHRPTRRTLLTAISNVLWMMLNKTSDHMREPPDPGGGTRPIFARDSPSLPRTIIGVHILAQGALRFIRRRLWASRESALTIPTAKKVDPEAALSSQIPRSNSINSDKNSDGSTGSPTDGRPPGPPPVAAEVRETYAGKKKRKQATFVRSQQPFWAALAHTKVTVSNQMEQTHLSLDQSEAHATDLHHIGNANFRTESDRVWITGLGPTDISFGIALSEADRQEEDGSRQNGKYNAQPFYVRVNGAKWSSMRITEREPAVREDGEQVRVWHGEIFGLTALCNYHCQFVRSSNDSEIYSASLITQPAPYTEQAPAPQAHQALRPSSPTTTLKNSIAAAELKLAEQRNKLKRLRKEHKSSTTGLKREVDNLSNKLASAGSNDDKNVKRSSQLRQAIQQADQATTAAEAEAKELGEIPEDELDAHREKKSLWQKELDKLNARRAELDQAKGDSAREISNVVSEINSATQKHERLDLRKQKLNEQHDRLISARAQDADQKQKRDAYRQAQAMDRATTENRYLTTIDQFQRIAEDYRTKTVQTISQSQHLEALILQQAQYQGQAAIGQSAQFSTPTTPEGPLPGTSGIGNPSNRNSFPPFNFQFPAYDALPQDPMSVTSAPGSGAMYASAHRGRSSSMLSGVSGFTDNMDEEPNGNVNGHPAYAYALNGRKGSGDVSSSSGSGSSSGSQRDPMSP